MNHGHESGATLWLLLVLRLMKVSSEAENKKSPFFWLVMSKLWASTVNQADTIEVITIQLEISVARRFTQQKKRRAENTRILYLIISRSRQLFPNQYIHT